MTGLVSWVALGLITAFIAPPFIPPQFRGWQFDYGLRALGALLIVFGIFSTSYAHVGDGKFAQLFRIYGGGSLTGGKIVAVDGENGPQARILRPGFQVSLLLNVLYDVDATKTETEIPDGKVGVLTAKDGAPLRPGQAFADPFPKNPGLAMLDAETFLRNGGQRGPQLTVLTPGKYPLNDYLWKVDIKDAKDVPTGFVGVVKSNVWAEVDFGTLRADKPTSCDVISNKDKSEGRLEAPIVPVGCVGVWKDSLQPGKYYFNPGAFSITEIDTRVQVWTYAGGYDRCTISLEVDSKGEITQKRDCRPVQTIRTTLTGPSSSRWRAGISRSSCARLHKFRPRRPPAWSPASERSTRSRIACSPRRSAPLPATLRGGPTRSPNRRSTRPTSLFSTTRASQSSRRSAGRRRRWI